MKKKLKMTIKMTLSIFCVEDLEFARDVTFRTFQTIELYFALLKYAALTDAHKEVVSAKMDKIFKHEEKIIRERIELERSSKSSSHENEFVAKGHLELKGTTITISSASDNIFKSIDDLVEKLDRGLRRRSRLKKVKRKQSCLQELPNAA